MSTQTGSIELAKKQQLGAGSKLTLWDMIKRDRFLLLLAAPGLLYFLIFKYLPMWGLIIVFQEYSPYDGIIGSQWVGFEHFIRFFSHKDFFLLLRNTLAISMFNLVFFFPLPIILSLMLNEVVNSKFKRIIQTVVYLPHFLSWVIIFGITYLLLSQSEGLVNKMIEAMGFKSIDFLANSSIFWILVTIQAIWKECGWGTVIFLASIAGVDPNLYEAARMDGANKLRQMWHVTLPAIRPTIIVLLILRMGNIIDVSFEHIYLMMNGAVSNVADVFDTYVYRVGIRQGQYSYSAAIGFFKSIVGFIMVLITNKLSKVFGEEGIY